MDTLHRQTLRSLAVTAAGLFALHAAALRAQDGPLTLTLSGGGNELRAWDGALNQMARVGDLQVRRLDTDPLVPSRAHERLDQYHNGVRVFGADVSRQTDAGTTVSIFGTLHTNIDVSTEPRLSVSQAALVVQRESGVEVGPARLPRLLILPEEGGTYRLVYQGSVFSPEGAFEYLIDATNGAVLQRLDAMRRQSAVGIGTGVLGDTKKMSVISSNGVFLTDDALRPPALLTFDMKQDLQRTLDFMNGLIALGAADRASDTDNRWEDGATVDAHASAGYVYDYYFKRFGRRGLDDNNLRIISLVHPVDRQAVLSQPPNVIGNYYLNAFYAGSGVVVYGDGLPPNVTAGGQRWNYLAGGLDVDAHELTHGVTEFTSRLIYRNESGALNESFSDMMGTAVEFFYQAPGSAPMRADYVIGEDVVTPGGLRSMENPGAYGQPDHYSKRVVVVTPTVENDNGGVHTNSGIGNQAYYLAIEGGTNRTSGLSVQGVGQSNREQIERVMYRAFAQLMPSNATYSVARAATIQAARDLYGPNGGAERAMTQAWTAVGVE